MSDWRYPGYDAGDEIEYAYDDVGRLVTITDNMPATAKETEVDYDQDTGAMVKVTLPNGTVTTLEYDDLGRLTQLVNAKSAGGPVITSCAYRYDDDAIHSGLGLVDRITHEDGRFDTFSYDAHERLTTEHYKTPQDATLFRFDYTYDDDGNRYRKEYRDNDSLRVYCSDTTGATSDGEDTNLAPSNRVARAWTRTGETGPTKMGDKINVTGSFTEENVASIAVEANDSGTPTYATWREDGFWIARGIDLDDSDENTLEVTITDKADNSTTYPVSPATYEAKLDENLNVVYEYDAVGNVKKKTEVVDYDVGGGGTYITRYFYDDANRLEYIAYNWTTTKNVHYVYDPVGQRVEIRYGQITLSGEEFSSFSPAAGQARGFVCLGGGIIEEWTVSDGGTTSHTDDSLSTLAYRYVRNPATDLGGGIGSIIYQIDGSDYRYYHYNHKGDVGALTDGDTDICAWYEYDAWGNVVADWEASGVENEFRFSTKQWDATPPDANGTAPDAGLIYFGARYLDPNLGRCTQLDPAGTIDGLNMYPYVRSAPTMFMDSYGLLTTSPHGPMIPPEHPPCTPGPGSPPPPKHCAGFLYYGWNSDIGLCVPVCVLPPASGVGLGPIPILPPYLAPIVDILNMMRNDDDNSGDDDDDDNWQGGGCKRDYCEEMVDIAREMGEGVADLEDLFYDRCIECGWEIAPPMDIWNVFICEWSQACADVRDGNMPLGDFVDYSRDKLQ